MSVKGGEQNRKINNNITNSFFFFDKEKDKNTGGNLEMCIFKNKIRNTYTGERRGEWRGVGDLFIKHAETVIEEIFWTLFVV